MPKPLIWTTLRDAELAARRQAGGAWDDIAQEMGISRNAAIERARKIGARMARPKMERPDYVSPDRPALPAGHPVAWAVLNENTSLAGCDYPYPVFPDNPRRH